jgi:AraC-like DNA-binding protein/membrane protein YdbS with pleckstrin-like domain
MELSFHYEYFISLLTAVVALILLFAHREQSLSPRILALFFLCVSYMVFFYALVRYGDFIHFPHLWRTSVFVGTLQPVLAFIYVRSVLEQRYGFQRSDILLLAVPFLLALTFLGFYILPAEAKEGVIREALSNKSLYLQENEGILPPRFALLFRDFFAISLVMAQGVLLYRWNKHTRPRLPENPQNRSIFRWLVFLTATIGLTFALTTIQQLFQFFQAKDFYWITSSTVMVAVVSALVYLLIRPNILYGLHGWVKPVIQETLPDGPAAETKPLSRKWHMSAAYGEKLRDKVEAYIGAQQPYLRRGYTIANMSAELGVPLYQLSAFINQQYGQSFNEFINGYRVQYIKDVLLKEPDAEQYTLEALGKKAGFNSRSTFIAAVKKQTGQTPSAFLFSKEVEG